MSPRETPRDGQELQDLLTSSGTILLNDSLHTGRGHRNVTFQLLSKLLVDTSQGHTVGSNCPPTEAHRDPHALWMVTDYSKRQRQRATEMTVQWPQVGSTGGLSTH